MAETLVTQYAGTVDNDNLPKLGELRFSITPAQNTNVRYNLLELSTKAGEGDVVVSVIGNGYITDANRTANLGTSKTIAAGANMDKTYFSNGTFTVVVSNKYAITALIGGTGASGSCNYKNWSFDIEQLRGMSNLTNLQFHTSGFYGDIISLSSLTNLEELDFRVNELIYGDIKAISNCNKLAQITITSNFNIIGQLSAFANKPDLYFIYVPITGISDDIINMPDIPNLSVLHFTKCKNLTGDISIFAKFPKLNYVTIHDTQLYGNVSVFSDKTRLQALYVNKPRSTLTGTSEQT